MIYTTSNQSYKDMLAAKGNDCISFFTPTYNRALFLSRVEECLEKQTRKDFVWVIVDDGSKDNTDIVVKGMMKKNTLPILYIQKENGGKHSAFKVALDNCQTAYFQCMDDDDIYYEDAVDFYLSKWAEIQALSGGGDICAIRTLSRHPDGRIVANFKIVENEEYDASTIETNYVMRRSQENWTCYDTEKLRSVDLFRPYWMSEQHKFVMESIWQTRLARKYRCRYVNRVFREYRNDDQFSLSRSNKSHQHWVDVFLNEKVILDEQYDLIKQYRGFKYLLKHALIVNCMRDYLDIKYLDLIKNTENKAIRRLYHLTWLPSLMGKTIIKIAINRHK